MSSRTKYILNVLYLFLFYWKFGRGSCLVSFFSFSIVVFSLLISFIFIFLFFFFSLSKIDVNPIFDFCRRQFIWCHIFNKKNLNAQDKISIKVFLLWPWKNPMTHDDVTKFCRWKSRPRPVISFSLIIRFFTVLYSK